ncbi:unnamed protein product, partial [Polarella glacialis]
VSRNPSLAPSTAPSVRPPSPCPGVPRFARQGTESSLWQAPSLSQLLQDSAEGKIRKWLSTIPIGNGAERGWDDSQILEIAEFAEEKQIEHLSAEEIYKRYVEHQVMRAEAQAAKAEDNE